MTGRDAADYILINHYDSAELTVVVDGHFTDILDIVMEPASGKLVILFDKREKKDE